MPLLDAQGPKPEEWQRLPPEEAANSVSPLVSWEALPAVLPLRGHNQRLGVEIPNDIDVESLAPLLSRLSLVSIRFPAFADVRGFSIARQIRRLGFTGTLRAHGPLIADQFAYALACGFDEIELPEASAARQPVEQWLKARQSISHGYQRGYGDSANILDQRRAARRATETSHG